MRVPLFLTLSYLIVAVWAGGYAGCLERIWLYQAYLIDELNDEADRTVGYKCKKWDYSSHVCKNNEWEACNPKRKGETRCQFGDLVVSTGKTDGKKTDWEVKNADGKTMNVEETAKQCLSRYTDKTKYKNAYGSVFNFPGHTALKGAGEEFNDYIKKLGDAVTKTAQSKKTAANKNRFDDFDAITEKILTARAGDHGKFAVPAAEKELGASNVETKLRASGNPTLSKQISDYYDRMYGTNAKNSKISDEKKAYDHGEVVNTYKQVQADLAKCT
ncbi:hypothetical protein B0H65DRAFT_434405 [Neurospora tetraspora]|uniref:Uncharacterized protein n=1 Tax=Neurospora tetraspora TaxID=94610 RepID=A0AAE0MNG2_9PEZI|nr:hypothetical protein B0H65DRAFT_434405 [Neurospora tetraspora]